MLVLLLLNALDFTFVGVTISEGRDEARNFGVKLKVKIQVPKNHTVNFFFFSKLS